jgi:Tol biopolymer transport system component
VDVPGTPFRAPAGQPDGAQLAILGDDEDVPYRSDTSAWTVGADGTDLVEVASLAGAAAGAHSLDWHPDSESLLLSSAEALGIWTVSLVDLATGEVPTLAEDAGMAAWSPDGDGVYYFTGAGDDRWGLAYGVIEDGALVADRSLGPTVVPLYQYYGLDAGACAAVG